MHKVRGLVPIAVFVCALLIFVGGVWAQETTGGLQGTVKDPSGAVVPGAKVVVTASSLTGTKEEETDGSGYYRFANLPPGNYTITVTAAGFATSKREVPLEVGHLPSVDFALEVGKTSTIVEVSGEAPQIDVTTNVTTTNVTEDVIMDIPHGRSYQSVIQFAPSARNEPLMGNNTAGGYAGNGTGGSSPGSTANGGDHGFSVAGGSDSENSYLVEGQETANLIGGYSHTSVPFDFIDQVEIKNSGISAEHGGALGGVVNVIMKKGANELHGSIFSYFENQAMDANEPTTLRYNPQLSQTATSWGLLDAPYQLYSPKKDKTSDVFPGFTLSGPLWKDRIFGFIGFNPEFNDIERTVDDTQSLELGPISFAQNTQTYYSNARVDAEVSKKLRVYASWLYQLSKQSGENMPFADSNNGLYNISSSVDPAAYAHSVGFTAPNLTMNVGADYSISPRLIATGRFGYYFENYHDFGLPTAGTLTVWETNGLGADANCAPVPPATTCTPSALPLPLQQGAGYFNLANSQNFTGHNASKGVQVDADLAWFKSGWKGTHNFKFGYQLNRLNNDIEQHYNVPLVQYFVGSTAAYTPYGPVGAANCAAYITLYGQCSGQYGYVNVVDYGSGGTATSFNHSLFAQDSWSIAKGVTINLGIRVEKEWLPAENQPTGGISHPINFGWGDKIAPRLGIAWDPLRNGKIKVFGGYGQFYDQMKLNLAISSFGGQYWSNCYYALDTDNVALIAPVFNSNNRYCFGDSSAGQANFAGGTTPAGITFLENQNYRANPTTCSTCTVTEEGVAPGLKPYKQHEYTAGVDYQISPTLAFEARYDRRRLDHVIEDSALVNPSVGETFVIVNPGQGVNSTYDKFYDFLYGVTTSDCGAACAGMELPAIRNYDGVELRLTKTSTKHWNGMVSYTYSRLYGNYTGLTSSDQADGGGGRNSPNNSRAFDEPYFSWSANGTPSTGLLPTDRPNTFKGYVYYELGWLKSLTTDFGIFQVMYQGSPETSFMDVGNAFPGAFPVDVVGRGKWMNVTQDPTTGLITVGNGVTQRTPWYNQTDFNLQQAYRISEKKTLSFSATLTNLFNERSVTSVDEQVDSVQNYNFVAPGGYTSSAGTPFYAAAIHPYNLTTLMNSALTSPNCPTTSNPTGVCGPETVNSAYGQPNRWQAGRTIKLGVRFQF
ncbi:MAG: TonB-dependent receptor [Candidatus Acidiferrum sp.]|jgi:hypothetical protein